MPKLPVISGKEAVRAFEKDGWKIVRRAKSRDWVLNALTAEFIGVVFFLILSLEPFSSLNFHL